MPRLPVLSGKEVIDLLVGIGFKVVRQRGSHVSLQKGTYQTVVPLHDELARGTLAGILKQTGVTRDDLFRLLDR